MRLRPWVRFGLFVGVVAGLLLMATQLLSVDPAHARTVEEPLELASGDCCGYTGGPVGFRGQGSAVPPEPEPEVAVAATATATDALAGDATAAADVTTTPEEDDIDGGGSPSTTLLIVIALALVLGVGGGLLVWRRRAPAP